MTSIDLNKDVLTTVLEHNASAIREIKELIKEHRSDVDRAIKEMQREFAVVRQMVTLDQHYETKNTLERDIALLRREVDTAVHTVDAKLTAQIAEVNKHTYGNLMLHKGKLAVIVFIFGIGATLGAGLLQGVGSGVMQIVEKVFG